MDYDTGEVHEAHFFITTIGDGLFPFVEGNSAELESGAYRRSGMVWRYSTYIWYRITANAKLHIRDYRVIYYGEMARAAKYCANDS